MTWPFRRVLCWLVGHRLIIETRGEPVCVFWVCWRCGKFGR